MIYRPSHLLGSALYFPTPPLIQHPIQFPTPTQTLWFLHSLPFLCTKAWVLSSKTFSTSQLLLSQSSEINTNSISENDICFKNISLYYTERHFMRRDGSKLQPPESPSPLLEPSRMVAEDARAHRDCSQTWQARLHTFIQAILTSRKMLINHYFYKLKKKC